MQTDRFSQRQWHPHGWKGHSKSMEGIMWHLVYTDGPMHVGHEAAVTLDKRDIYSYKFMVWMGYSELRTQTMDRILSGWGRWIIKKVVWYPLAIMIYTGSEPRMIAKKLFNCYFPFCHLWNEKKTFIQSFIHSVNHSWFMRHCLCTKHPNFKDDNKD